jgi:putative aldouronate transport system substrate-binding protein
MHSWWKAGYMPKDTKNFEEDGTSRLNADKAGKLFAWQIWYAPGYDKTYSAQVGHEEVFVPSYDPIFETADVFGGMQAISANSQNKERAMMFLNLLNTDKTVGTLVRHGIENTHYVMKGEQLDRTAVAGIDVKNHPYDYVFGWQFGTVFNQIWDVSYPSDIQDVFMNYNKATKPTNNLGFNFDAAPVQTEVAALQNVISEFGSLNYGMIDPDKYLPQFIDKLKASGSEKVLAEVKKQVGEWKATK